MKEKAFVYTHLGIGDMICMIGAVRYIATLYEKVYVVCKNKDIDTMKDLYSDTTSLVLVTVNDDLDLYPWSEKSKHVLDCGFDIYSCGLLNLKKTPCIYDFPNSFYDDLEIPREVRITHFKVPFSEASKTLFESFQGRPYIVVHQNSSTGSLPIVARLRSRGETRLIVDLNENQVDVNLDPEGHAAAAKAIFRPFTEYVKLFEGADEMHMIDSSVFAFAIHLDLKKVKEKTYYFRSSDSTYVRAFGWNHDDSFLKLSEHGG